MQIQTAVGQASAPDGANPQPRSGRDTDLIVSEYRGKYAEAGSRGQIFMGSTVIAGVVIPVAAATLNSKFTLWNPAGALHEVELFFTPADTNSARDAARVPI